MWIYFAAEVDIRIGHKFPVDSPATDGDFVRSLIWIRQQLHIEFSEALCEFGGSCKWICDDFCLLHKKVTAKVI